MDDLDVLARDFGFGARGKSNPMRSGAQSDRRSIDEPLFSDVFGGPPKYTTSSNPINSEFDYDSIFKSSEPKNNNNNSSGSSNQTASSLPVYDKPVYDEDIFDGLPGLKNKSGGSTVKFDNSVFAFISSPPRSNTKNQKSDFDDLLGNLGRNEKVGEDYKSCGVKSSLSAKGFDDLLAGYSTGSSAASNRPTPVSSRSSGPIANSKNGNILDDPFVVLESSATPGSSSPEVFVDPLEEINKFGKSGSARVEATSSSGGGAFDELNPLSGFGKAVQSFSSNRDDRGKNESPPRTASTQSDTSKEQKGDSSFRYSDRNTRKKVPVDNAHESPFFNVPNISPDFEESFSQPISPQYHETGSHIDTSPVSERQGHQFDDIWLTVSEIPLFTQPTAAPPPSRPPPPLPWQTSKSETGYFSSSSRKKGDGFISPKGPPVSQFDELEDFAMDKSGNNVDKSSNFHYSEETNAFSAAAACAAAMKNAMDNAEAKFRHAKEVREREYVKAARNKESVQLERDVNDVEDIEFSETQERLERERKQMEEEERERMRIQRLKREQEKAGQAVERATREARERASVDARERAATEARLKAERAAVEKANAEARVRAERAAVQRAQAETRERAAAEAKERAEKAAAEARERAVASAAAAKEKELRAKVAASKAEAEAEARRRADQAAVERAAAEARERAAAEARRAAAAKLNQQKNDNDLESFFSTVRPSSAPRTQTSSVDPLFNQQFQNRGGYDAPRWTSASNEPSSSLKKPSSTINIVDDLSSIFGGAPSSGEFPDVEGETEERRRARLDRHQRTQERAAKALSEKNQRDAQVQREQEERHRISETLDIEIKRWSAGKEGNLRALLSTLQYVLWPECGWQPVSLTDLIIGASVKKYYRKATLCIHPDKVQQKGATLQQKFIAEKVFDLLKEAWNKFNSEELF